ncbi:MAG: hypothetical protein KIT56_10105, partial [Gammaproteobacteria bacterium]|nr:hypothetical protein [Gammaproteobacteria bacterium]
EHNYVTLNDMADPKNTEYIAVVPMYTSHKQFIGIFVVKEMSFWRLNAETLQIMQILTLYFSEEVAVVQQTKDLLVLFPDCPPDFLKELGKLLYLKKSIGIDSSIVAIRIDNSDQVDNILFSIKKQQRGFDYLWHRHLENTDFLLTLMPFTNAVGSSGYFARINTFLLETYGKKIGELGITERSMLLYDQKPELILNEILGDIMEVNVNG